MPRWAGRPDKPWDDPLNQGGLYLDDEGAWRWWRRDPAPDRAQWIRYGGPFTTSNEAADGLLDDIGMSTA